MSATSRALFVVVLVLWGSGGVSGVSGVSGLSRLPGTPRNVKLTSHNMNLVLNWEPPEGAADDLVYTAHVSPQAPMIKFREACTNTSHLHCDFSRLKIAVYGTYIGRVRAELGPQSSAWAESEEVTLDNDSVIGPPNVTLISSGTTIEVIIKDPVFVISTLRGVYSSSTYSITYWMEGRREKAKNITGVQQDRQYLSDLEERSRYCVQVKVNVGRSITHPSELSEPVCERTRNKETVPWIGALVTFLVLGGIIALVVVAVVYWKIIYSFFCPKDVMPQHFKQYLLTPLESSLHLAMPQEVFHQLIIVTQDKTGEDGPSPDPPTGSCSMQPDMAPEERQEERKEVRKTG